MAYALLCVIVLGWQQLFFTICCGIVQNVSTPVFVAVITCVKMSRLSQWTRDCLKLKPIHRRSSAQNVSNLSYHFVSLPSFLYFLFTFNTVYAASHHKVMSLLWWRSSAQNVSNLFYRFVSLPSFLYFLFTFNTVYAVSHHKVMSLLWWRTSA